MVAEEEFDDPSNEDDGRRGERIQRRGERRGWKEKEEGIKCVDRILFIVLSVDSP